MFGIRRETVERLRREYPVGCRVELVQMDDVQAPPIGTKGTVRGVDDIGSIMVTWSDGTTAVGSRWHTAKTCAGELTNEEAGTEI